MKRKSLFSKEKTLAIAFAYVGIITGAGLATGQEILQYFVSFGRIGIIGLVCISILHMVIGSWVLSLASYHQTSNHVEGLESIASPWLAKVLDWILSFSCFVMCFVLVAGAGSTFQQQFGTPAWVGSLICALLILGISYLDFDKVTAALGFFTPILLVMISLGLIVTLFQGGIDWSSNFAMACELHSAIPNIWLSILNYFALCLVTAISMFFVLGGQVMGLENAKYGGAIGGFLAGFVSLLVGILLYTKVDLVGYEAVPMQSLMQAIHPALGFIMFVLIFGMIFNTGISVAYALGKRIAGDNERRFKTWVMPLICTLAFILSFAGFSELVSIMYPILGYIGIVLVGLIIIAWWKDRQAMSLEEEIRQSVYHLLTKRQDPDQTMVRRDVKNLKQLVKDSKADNQQILEQVQEIVDRQTEE